MKRKQREPSDESGGGWIGKFARTYRFFCSDTAVLRGDREATIYNCRRIVHHSPTRICLCLGRVSLTVTGEGLYCTSFSAGTLTVRGRVTSLALCNRESCAGCAERRCATACEGAEA